MRKNQIKPFLHKWKHKLYLNDWSISVQLDGPESSDPHTLAVVNVDSVYLTAYITIHPRFYSETNATQEHSLIHELCHIYTSELAQISRDLARGVIHHDHHVTDAVERLTQRVADLAFFGKQGAVK